MPIDHTIPFLNPFSEFILQDVVEGLGPTKAASHLIKLEAVGEKRLEHLEISFHKEFHPQHNWTLKKHHWRNFCIFIGLAQEPNPDCAPCARVMENAAMSLDEAAAMSLPPSCPTPSTLLGEFPTTTAYYCI